MTTLRLTRPTPVTFAEAEAIIDEDGHGEADGNPDGLARVYVSPEVDGWTLVIGWWCDPCDGAQGDGSAWLIAERGAVLRRYCATGEAGDDLFTLGEPLPLERARREELGLSPAWDEAARGDEAEDEWKSAAFHLAPEIATALGTSPLTLTAETRVRGTGVLALTPHPTSAEAGPVA
ncbi:hypothetical protein ACWCQW_25855 [Streptomyces mirabilis]